MTQMLHARGNGELSGAGVCTTACNIAVQPSLACLSNGLTCPGGLVCDAITIVSVTINDGTAIVNQTVGIVNQTVSDLVC